ncbi:MAG: Hsp20/alpha crystallin family protein [Anaerolineales bacterium]|nr:Hsp20/alpha crystallin family protein [Anaerolineales bacterium]MCX7753891.1 Hsp20/alpha crystallin family protein [Anaerolineales bacterium]MDW8276845.1 Hsp20/alpha crystallin family protein [Anaerolineales bacterium]
MATVILRSTSGPDLPEKRRMLLETLGWQVRIQPHVWSPPTDLFENEQHYIVRVEVAGMRRNDFSVVLQNNLLTISGTRPDTPERRAYHQMEVRFGEFSTTVALPGPVEAQKASAEYEDGFLTVTLPKASPSKIYIR